MVHSQWSTSMGIFNDIGVFWAIWYKFRPLFLLIFLSNSLTTVKILSSKISDLQKTYTKELY
jgi:hypothetical protein